MEHGIFYKYVDLNTLKLILDNRTLKFSKVTDFNDPFDCYSQLLEFNVTEEFLRSHLDKGILKLEEEDSKLSMKDLIPITQEKYYNLENDTVIEFLNNILNEWRISCFSKNYDEVLMWSHYSKKHTGACIGVDSFHLFKTVSKILPLVVGYTNEFKKYDMCTNEVEGIKYAFSTKSKGWHYENEIRLVTVPGKEKNMDQNGVVPIVPFTISEIFLGCNFKGDPQDFKSQYVSKGFSHVKFRKMKKSTNSFALNPIAL